MKPIFHIEHLHYKIDRKIMLDVRDMSVLPKDMIHLRGQSGIGKSLFGLSLIGIFAKDAIVNYKYNIALDPMTDWRRIRHDTVGYIFQQPRAYFNPVRTCGDQLLELCNETSENSKSKIILWTEQLKLSIGTSIFQRYPHEFSIGELQRIYVISALIRNPKFIIADEPFAHIDWPTAKIVAGVLQNYIEDNQAALLLISHERPGTLLEANRYWHLDGGLITEVQEDPKLAYRTEEGSLTKYQQDPSRQNIRLSGIKKKYTNKLFNFSKKSNALILDNIDLTINPGDRIGIMGNSGSGKTTLAKIIAGLEHPTDGKCEQINELIFDWRSVFDRKASPVQLVFQDPFSSFNSAQPLGKQILTTQNADEVNSLMKKLALDHGILKRTSRQLSGGELQRLAIIRALSGRPGPRLIILDEALSALDENSRKTTLKLFHTEYPDLALLFISHRFYKLKDCCRRIFFIVDGRIDFEWRQEDENWTHAPAHVRKLAGQL